MVVRSSGRGEGPGDSTPRQGGRPGAGGTRRQVARGLLGAGLAAVFAPAVASCSPGATGHHADKHPGDVPHGGGNASQEVAFDEVYRGRRPLHLMRRADGTYLTMVDHYASYPTPLAAARAAVDELGPGRRLRDPGTGHGPGEGGDRGVHA